MSLVLLCCLMRFAPAQAAECSKVTSEYITGRDLAHAFPALNRIPPETIIGYAPLPGSKRIFHPGDVLSIARRNNIPIETAPEICFEWPMQASRPRRSTESHATLPTDAQCTDRPGRNQRLSSSGWTARVPAARISENLRCRIRHPRCSGAEVCYTPRTGGSASGREFASRHPAADWLQLNLSSQAIQSRLRRSKKRSARVSRSRTKMSRAVGSGRAGCSAGHTGRGRDSPRSSGRALRSEPRRRDCN